MAEQWGAEAVYGPNAPLRALVIGLRLSYIYRIVETAGDAMEGVGWRLKLNNLRKKGKLSEQDASYLRMLKREGYLDGIAARNQD